MSDVYDREAMDAVDAFRQDRGLATAQLGSPRGLVDRQTVDELWKALEEIGRADQVRRSLLDGSAIRR